MPIIPFPDRKGGPPPPTEKDQLLADLLANADMYAAMYGRGNYDQGLAARMRRRLAYGVRRPADALTIAEKASLWGVIHATVLAATGVDLSTVDFSSPENDTRVVGAINYGSGILLGYMAAWTVGAKGEEGA